MSKQHMESKKLDTRVGRLYNTVSYTAKISSANFISHLKTFYWNWRSLFDSEDNKDELEKKNSTQKLETKTKVSY